MKNINIKKILISAVLFVVTIELSSRIDDWIQYDAPLFGTYNEDRLRTEDNEAITCNVPNISYEKWVNNSLGFRGPELHEDAQVKNVVACMGASETYGLYESKNKEWPAQLRQKFSTDKSVEIVNTATVGIDFKNFKRYIEKYVLPINPKVIILFVASFHHATTLIRERKMFSVTDSKTMQVASFQIIGNLRVANKLKLAVKQVIPEGLLKWYQIWSTKRQLAEIAAQRLHGGKSLDVIPDFIIEDLERELQDLIDFLKTKNLKIILATYPTLISEENFKKYPEILLGSRRFCIELSQKGMIDALNKYNNTIREFAESQNLYLVDLDKKLSGDRNNFNDYVHFTDEGAKKVSDLMYAKLIEIFSKGTKSEDN